jgi:hypothetical protein
LGGDERSPSYLDQALLLSAENVGKNQIARHNRVGYIMSQDVHSDVFLTERWTHVGSDFEVFCESMLKRIAAERPASLRREQGILRSATTLSAPDA